MGRPPSSSLSPHITAHPASPNVSHVLSRRCLDSMIHVDNPPSASQFANPLECGKAPSSVSTASSTRLCGCSKFDTPAFPCLLSIRPPQSAPTLAELRLRLYWSSPVAVVPLPKLKTLMPEGKGVSFPAPLVLIPPNTPPLPEPKADKPVEPDPVALPASPRRRDGVTES